MSGHVADLHGNRTRELKAAFWADLQIWFQNVVRTAPEQRPCWDAVTRFQPSRMVMMMMMMERGVSLGGTLTKCRKLFSWRGFQPLDWGEIAFSVAWVLGSASLEFPPWKKNGMPCECQINKSSGSVHVRASFTATNPPCESRVWPDGPGPPLMSSVGEYRLLWCDAYYNL